MCIRDSQEEYITDEADLKVWLSNYYEIEFQDCGRMYFYVEGVRAETQLEIKEDGSIYMEMLKDADGEYWCLPHIEYLDEDELILKIVYTHETQVIYFQKDNN